MKTTNEGKQQSRIPRLLIRKGSDVGGDTGDRSDHSGVEVAVIKAAQVRYGNLNLVQLPKLKDHQLRIHGPSRERTHLSVEPPKQEIELSNTLINNKPSGLEHTNNSSMMSKNSEVQRGKFNYPRELRKLKELVQNELKNSDIQVEPNFQKLVIGSKSPGAVPTSKELFEDEIYIEQMLQTHFIKSRHHSRSKIEPSDSVIAGSNDLSIHEDYITDTMPNTSK